MICGDAYHTGIPHSRWRDDAAGAYQAHEEACCGLAVPVLIAAGCRPGDFWRAGMNVDAYMGKIGLIDKMQTISMQRAGSCFGCPPRARKCAQSWAGWGQDNQRFGKCVHKWACVLHICCSSATDAET